MDDLLATKLHVPPVRAAAVARPHLLARLQAGLQRASTFALVAGPAGAGKTTVLSQFAEQHAGPVAWLSLDESENHTVRYWRYVVAALRSQRADFGRDLSTLLASQQPPSGEAIPALLINELDARDEQFVLFLDDYHLIRQPSLHEQMLLLLSHLPFNLYVIVATRIDPPWPLARWRARNQLVEIRADALRFDTQEAAGFVNRTMRLNLTQAEVEILAARTEGWAAGLQLAAISLAGQPDRGAHIQAFGGSQLYVADYLLDEVLAQLPPTVQQFLLHTSILKRMNAALCEAVTGCDEAQSMLMELYHANIFLIPLDDAGVWFRYHHLWAELLRAQLGRSHPPADVEALYLRASTWFEHQGLLDEAIDHALAGEAHARAADLIDEAGRARVLNDHYTLQQWLDALPPAVVAGRPRLAVYRMLTDLGTGKLDMREKTLREQEELIKALPTASEHDELRLRAMIYLALFMAHQNPQRSIAMANSALDVLPLSEPAMRSYLYSALYRAYGMEGDFAQATSAYRQCLTLAHAARDYGIAANTTMVRAFDLCQYGRLDEAEAHCREILAAGEQQVQQPFYAAGPLFIALGGLALERYELDQAAELLERGLELCRRRGMDGLYTGQLQWARLQQARHDLAGAQTALHQVARTLQRSDFTMASRQVSLRLAMRDVVGAAELVPSIRALLTDDDYANCLPLIATEALQLCLARIALAQGDLTAAARLVEAVEETVTPGERWGRLLEVRLLSARLEQLRMGEPAPPAALNHVLRALELGRTAGMVLLFVEEGATLLPLLRAITAAGSAAAANASYARKLIGFATGEILPRAPGSAEGLIEALTPREMEVLQFVAAGSSNLAIADQLFITVRTVKKHVTNILAKLDAHNRTEAVARARQLGLLPSD